MFKKQQVEPIYAYWIGIKKFPLKFFHFWMECHIPQVFKSENTDLLLNLKNLSTCVTYHLFCNLSHSHKEVNDVQK